MCVVLYFYFRMGISMSFNVLVIFTRFLKGIKNSKYCITGLMVLHFHYAYIVTTMFNSIGISSMVPISARISNGSSTMVMSATIMPYAFIIYFEVFLH